jgi:hypothetical protein
MQHVPFNNEIDVIQGRHFKPESVIYLDRYMSGNINELCDIRKEVRSWHIEINKKLQMNELPSFAVSTPQSPVFNDAYTTQINRGELINSITNTAQLPKEGNQSEEQESENIMKMIDSLQETAKLLKYKLINHQLTTLKNKIEDCYIKSNFNKLKYQLYAVLLCRKQASDGNHWVCVYNHEEEKWFKYIGNEVTVVQKHEIFYDM